MSTAETTCGDSEIKDSSAKVRHAHGAGCVHGMHMELGVWLCSCTWSWGCGYVHAHGAGGVAMFMCVCVCAQTVDTTYISNVKMRQVWTASHHIISSNEVSAFLSVV